MPYEYQRYYGRNLEGWEKKEQDFGVNRCQFCGSDGGEDSICSNCQRDDYAERNKEMYGISVTLRGRRTR
jgi:hypothetical protein